MRALILLTLCCTIGIACGDERRVPTPVGPGPVTACGNGRIDRGETCDSRIATSSVGACPTSCNDGIACTTDRMVGTAASCNVACANDPISACQNDDKCCPMGCSSANDNDCSTTCNNGTVEATETCDGDCAAGCSDNVGCTTDTTYGAAATCNLACGYRVVSGCTSGDGCCGPGCTHAEDTDCSQTCGNNMIESGETCDGNCPGTCDDRNACTIDIASGNAASCNLSCTRQPVRSCTGGDGCCAPGCNNASDSDCPASCEAVSMCHSGDGCCPGDCTNARDSDCPVSCSAVTACTGGDTCCPSGCTRANDSDCTLAGPSPVGGPCSTPSDCAPISGLSVTCLRDGFPGGYCSAFCTSGGCPSGSDCDIMQFICLDLCTLSSPDCRTGYMCDTHLNQMERPFTGCAP